MFGYRSKTENNSVQQERSHLHVKMLLSVCFTLQNNNIYIPTFSALFALLKYVKLVIIIPIHAHTNYINVIPVSVLQPTFLLSGCDHPYHLCI